MRENDSALLSFEKGNSQDCGIINRGGEKAKNNFYGLRLSKHI